jgi:hypothetical protein
MQCVSCKSDGNQADQCQQPSGCYQRIRKGHSPLLIEEPASVRDARPNRKMTAIKFSREPTEAENSASFFVALIERSLSRQMLRYSIKFYRQSKQNIWVNSRAVVAGRYNIHLSPSRPPCANSCARGSTVSFVALPHDQGLRLKPPRRHCEKRSLRASCGPRVATSDDGLPRTDRVKLRHSKARYSTNPLSRLSKYRCLPWLRSKTTNASRHDVRAGIQHRSDSWARFAPMTAAWLISQETGQNSRLTSWRPSEVSSTCHRPRMHSTAENAR